jgi:hypothetical protein
MNIGVSCQFALRQVACKNVFRDHMNCNLIEESTMQYNDGK